MIDALKRLKKVPSDSKLHLIFQVLDQDRDGNIDINHALQVIGLWYLLFWTKSLIVMPL